MYLRFRYLDAPIFLSRYKLKSVFYKPFEISFPINKMQAAIRIIKKTKTRKSRQSGTNTQCKYNSLFSISVFRCINVPFSLKFKPYEMSFSIARSSKYRFESQNKKESAIWESAIWVRKTGIRFK